MLAQTCEGPTVWREWYIIAAKKNYQDARKFCALDGRRLATIDSKAAWNVIKTAWTSKGSPEVWIGMYKNEGLPDYHWDYERIASARRGMEPAEMDVYNGTQDWPGEPIAAIGWVLSTNNKITTTIQSRW